MAASTNTTTNFTNSSDANFRAWALAMHNAIVAGGWVNTGDTGQIDLATVTAPAAVNTSQGYKIYHSNDAGGGLVNYYLKVEFGSGGTSLNRPSLWVTAGWATDGAGNLVSTTYPVSTRTQIMTGATPAGASISINMAAGAGYICIAATSSLASEHLVFSVERTRDTSLALQNQVLINGTVNGAFSSGALSQTIDRLNAYPNSGIAEGTNAVMVPNASSPFAGNVGLGLVFGFAPGATSPSMNIFGVEDTALGVYQDTITVPILGVNHNYKLQRVMLLGSISTTVLLTRFE